jgi:hypothetical protein
MTDTNDPNCPKCDQPLTEGHLCIGMLDGMPVGERIGRRVLAIGPTEKKRAAEIIEATRAKPYVPGNAIPGEDERFVMFVPIGIRAVFTFTDDRKQGVMFRHLSVSLVDAPDRLPSPEIVFAIGVELFGFNARSEIRFGVPEPGEPAVIVMAQVLPDNEIPKGNP